MVRYVEENLTRGKNRKEIARCNTWSWSMGGGTQGFIGVNYVLYEIRTWITHIINCYENLSLFHLLNCKQKNEKRRCKLHHTTFKVDTLRFNRVTVFNELCTAVLKNTFFKNAWTFEIFITFQFSEFLFIYFFFLWYFRQFQSPIWKLKRKRESELEYALELLESSIYLFVKFAINGMPQWGTFSKSNYQIKKKQKYVIHNYRRSLLFPPNFISVHISIESLD